MNSVVFDIIIEFFELLRNFVTGKAAPHKPVKGLSEFYHNRVKYGTRINREFYIRANTVLDKNNPYYRCLSIDGKARFVNRMVAVMWSKKFKGIQGLKVTEEMRLLVSACIVQVTYGLKNFQLNMFDDIYLYPTTFYSKIINKELKGGTSPGGTIKLSWKDFKHGYAVEDDRYNLGLHEVAHALKLNVTEGNDFDDRFAYYLDRWLQIGKVGFKQLRSGENRFLRKYGGVNMHEFFAVCMEHFFELPEKFSKQMPDVYNHLCVLLNQNPLNKKEDYAYTADFAQTVNKSKIRIPIPTLIKKNFKYHTWHWSYGFWGVGLVFGMPCSFLLMENTIIPQYMDFTFLLILAIVGFVLQYKALVATKVFSLTFFPFYIITGFVPASVCALLLLNYGISIADHAETHNIKQVHRTAYWVLFDLENQAHQQAPEMRRIYFKNNRHISLSNPTQLQIQYETGLLGLATRLHFYVINNPKKVER